MKRIIAFICVAASLSVCAASGVSAAPVWLDEFRSDLYHDQISRAQGVADRQIELEPGDMQARFALGTARFLGAIEHLGQGLYRFGSHREYYPGYGLGLPIVRMPVPENPHPEPVTYAGLQSVIASFVDDLQSAGDALRTVTSARVELTLDIGQIRLDFDGSGVGTEDEVLSREVALLVGARNAAVAGSLTFDFDGADVLWLRAYCHLLSALGDIALGYDWHQAFEATFQGVFPNGPFPLSDALTNDAALQSRMSQLKAQMTAPPQISVVMQDIKPGTDQWQAAYKRWQQAYAAWQETEGGKKAREFDMLRSRQMFAGTVDLVTFLHLAQWPVADASRLSAVVENLDAMVTLSRGSWGRLLAETDSRSEWIPNPEQTGGLPGMSVTKERVSGWLSVLDQFDAVLSGKMLIPHWRFDRGVNLRRFFLEPRPFDLVTLIQGSSVLPYLEEGPILDEGSSQAIMRMFSGDFIRYFVYFN